MRLLIDGTEYATWKELTVVKTMGALCGQFNLSVHDNTAFDSALWKFKPTSEITLYIDSHKIITGYVENYNISYDKQSHDIVIAGREKTCDLVDCSFAGENNMWQDTAISTIIKKLVEPFGISVVIDSTAASHVTEKITFNVDEGVSVFDLIQKLIRKKAIIALTTNEGKLKITRVSSKTISHNIIGGTSASNVLSASFVQANRDRYSDYFVKGQGLETADKQPEDWLHANGTAEDSIFGSRYRPYVITADGDIDSAKCKDFAKLEARLRAGSSRTYMCKVQGWLNDTGSPWDINTLVPVSDSIFGVKDTLLVDSVTFRSSGTEGSTTELTLVSKAKYDIALELDTFKSSYDEQEG